MEGYIGYLIGIAGLTVALLNYFRLRVSKKIGFEVLHTTPIIQLRENLVDLEIRFKGSAIEELYISEILISNQGNKDISFADSERLILRPNTSILDVYANDMSNGLNVEVESYSPSGGRADINIDAKINLLKKREWIKLIVISKYKPDFDFSETRIQDVKSEIIDRTRPPKRKVPGWVTRELPSVIIAVSLYTGVKYSYQVWTEFQTDKIEPMQELPLEDKCVINAVGKELLTIKCLPNNAFYYYNHSSDTIRNIFLCGESPDSDYPESEIIVESIAPNEGFLGYYDPEPFYPKNVYFKSLGVNYRQTLPCVNLGQQGN